LHERGAFGEPKVIFRLKDWGVSRQRFWHADPDSSLRELRPGAGSR